MIYVRLALEIVGAIALVFAICIFVGAVAVIVLGPDPERPTDDYLYEDPDEVKAFLEKTPSQARAEEVAREALGMKPPDLN
jgi:cell division protein FtsL